MVDLHDIIELDWPVVKAGLNEAMYGDDEPIPMEVDDLATLASSQPRGRVATQLRWNQLSAEEFERLVFVLLSGESGYENVAWLTKYA